MRLTQQRLREVLNYDPETGLFTSVGVRKGSKFRKGDVVGNFNGMGYIIMMVDRKLYKAHRLAWLDFYGYLPENQVDHINRVRHDNRIKNLREVTQTCNNRNTAMHRTNTSGVKGVVFCKRDELWAARVSLNNRSTYYGHYKNFEDAVRARWGAEKLLGFPNCCSDSSAYIYLKERGLV